MKRIKISLVAIVLLLTALWLAADTLSPEPFTYFSFRGVFVQYSGVLGIGLMSIAMLLALRPKWLEPHLDGLDKIYRLHKWLGISALAVSILHWWWAKGTKWMVGWGWLEKPARKPNVDQTLGAIEGWLRSQRGLAESIGEWVFYAAVTLIVLALVKRFPYHLFVKTHKWLAAAYLALAYHSAVLTKFVYWTQPVGWVLATLLLGGSVAAVLTLTGRIGAGRKVQGTIESLINYPALRVLETTVVLDDGWCGHAAGQFAFVTSDKKEGAHPYTIASAWNPADHRLTFITKALGDHTSRLRERLKIGMPVTVEGPYGCFDFEDTQSHQIWIGAGIGITPFVARLKHCAANSDSKTIDLFHPTTEFDQTAIDRLTADATAAGVRLHLLVDGKGGRLNGERIRAVVPEWQSASFWFCGPPGFGQALRENFVANGLPPERFHQELFQMR
ncbi:ferredoxin reductase family protein [Paramagnetospirillum magneticum]|uniref:Predicted ferric reductase n=1 Tax=Paramagnetospirillum magneticum (strain ATCC 700264 / AMB-1) TaxID=342108 RepID=Q2W1Y6_PARM1|nr:ferric reductase-like transmembrane domain-containing protein [Paramagnetospirillum magneticum]BAE52139.1 Predicted ferric reductase [Paramagnetospirillum magneticum AMB-1]